jgi:hypothetical protein
MTAADENRFPPLPLEAWTDTKHTLHLYLQIVGKIRLALMPKRNHWWHVPLYVDARGLTTRPVPADDGRRLFEIQFDFVDHRLRIPCTDGREETFALQDGRSVASFYRRVVGALDALGIEASIRAVPYDHPDSTTPFADDTAHDAYSAEHVHRFWHILTQVEPIFQRFRGQFVGKSSPVHFFWHSFDLAHTRFSGREGTDLSGAGQVEQEAYSHEVLSFGFWAGDDDVPAPAFYAYAYPEPDGLNAEPLAPATAQWVEQENGSLALYPYQHARAATNPEAAILQFLESAYRAGATRADWDMERFALDA